MAENVPFAKVAGCLGILVLIMAISAGCITQTESGVFQGSPSIGSILDENNVIQIAEKWREQNEDGTFSYHARFVSGRKLLVDPALYPNLPVNVTGVGVEKMRGFLYGFENEMVAFYPVNISPYQDIKNRVVVVP